MIAVARMTPEPKNLQGMSLVASQRGGQAGTRSRKGSLAKLEDLPGDDPAENVDAFRDDGEEGAQERGHQDHDDCAGLLVSHNLER